VWYREHGGAVLSTTINKYCYITCRYLPPFFEHTHRIVYSKIEMVNSASEILHPAVKAVLQYMDIKAGVEIHHDGDLPARTGMGSSSSFTVGLLHAIYALKGVMPSKMQLAQEAIHIEQNIIKENVGSQDQVAAAVGGFNKIEFYPDDTIRVMPVIMKKERLERLQEQMMLYFTGISRTASDVAKKQIELTPQKKSELSTMRQMVDEALSILTNENTELKEFGKLLHEAWKLKRSLTDKISNSHIDNIYETAIRAGAAGGKLLGAGGGGFMLIFTEPELKPRIRTRLMGLLEVPFSFENLGSQIIFYQPDGYYRV
jgi:D-glycero-alpha-D-manno-heptose-7-phosphate kinase